MDLVIPIVIENLNNNHDNSNITKKIEVDCNDDKTKNAYNNEMFQNDSYEQQFLISIFY